MGNDAASSGSGESRFGWLDRCLSFSCVCVCICSVIVVVALAMVNVGSNLSFRTSLPLLMGHTDAGIDNDNEGVQLLRFDLD